MSTLREAVGSVRTKIVATVGPASRSPEIFRELIHAGVDVARLNFSHGTHADHSETLAMVRRIAAELGRPLAVLQDLGGPKIRLGEIPGGEVDCGLGERFRLVVERSTDDPRELTSTHPELPSDLSAGDVALFADGAVEMKVERADERAADLVVTLAGRLRSRQGINLPGALSRIPSLTEKDLRDLDWTRDNEVDYVGLSFVRTPEDVVKLRSELASRGIRARIIAKIEKPQAVENIEGIVAVSDAIMVARGDLGVEMDVALVPAIQKRVIDTCRRARVPVITATQMLNSMEDSSRPTRAESTDVFNAVLDGSDAVMLSGETAVGRYPIEAVSTMSRIVRRAESFLLEEDHDLVARSEREEWHNSGWIQPVTEGIVEAASLASRRLDAALTVVATNSGRTALAVSKHRHPTPTLALTDDPVVERVMNLYWGVTPLLVGSLCDTTQNLLELAVAWARARDLVRSGDRLIYLRGTIPGNAVHNAMVIHVVE
ncbi:MAG: pyruvate kinase [Isosphaeraceae bacterium]|nr:pyruvate kinase [Isosphaeraceae bacterium]